MNKKRSYTVRAVWCPRLCRSPLKLPRAENTKVALVLENREINLSFYLRHAAVKMNNVSYALPSPRAQNFLPVAN
jgi:hypothetical protein